MILVTGSNGQLAQCLKFLIKDAQYLGKQDCDITDPNSIEAAFNKFKPTVVINCAAYTRVDACETHKDLAGSVNSKGPKQLATLCRKMHVNLIHISTDYVFDGCKNTPYLESDPTTPKSVYGITKLEGENEIVSNADRFIIIRTSWLYSEFGNNFVLNIKKLMKEREKLGIVFDQIGSPTYAMDLAEVVAKFAKDPQLIDNQVYHYSNSGVTSWFDLTKEIQSLENIECEINPIESFEYPTPAARPSYSVFNTKKIKNKLNINIPHWKESLKICLSKLS